MKFDLLKNSLPFLILAVIALWVVNPAGAKSAGDLVAEGNELYLAGAFDQALQAYEQAESEAPTAEIYYNKGNVYYQMGDYKKAGESYELAAMTSGDLSFGSKCHFNLGSAFFQMAEAVRKENKKRSAELYELSSRHFREALRLNPDFTEAGRSMESVRITLQSVLNENETVKSAERELPSAKDIPGQNQGEFNGQQASFSRPDDVSKLKPAQMPFDKESAEQGQSLQDSDNLHPNRTLREDSRFQQDSPSAIFHEELENRRKSARSFRSVDQVVERDW